MRKLAKINKNKNTFVYQVPWNPRMNQTVAWVQRAWRIFDKAEKWWSISIQVYRTNARTWQTFTLTHTHKEKENHHKPISNLSFMYHIHGKSNHVKDKAFLQLIFTSFPAFLPHFLQIVVKQHHPFQRVSAVMSLYLNSHFFQKFSDNLIYHHVTHLLLNPLISCAFLDQMTLGIS